MKFGHIFLTITVFGTCKGSVSQTKCQEYGKAVYIEKSSPAVRRASVTTKDSECGVTSVSLIIGGTKALEKEFPHMALIGFGFSPTSQLSWDCGGTLISDLFILTAAHCLESRGLGAAQKIRLGTTHKNVTDGDLQERTVVKRIPYPEYKHLSKANDIALIEMDKPVKFTSHVRPACLNTKPIKLRTTVVASGFGKLKYEASTGSNNLMKVALEIYSLESCASALSMRDKLSETMLCAGNMAGGKDTCQGDSGGPLQVVLEDPFCMYSIIGVTSFGKFCGFANSPAIYTKVLSYIPWIEDIVWKGK